MTEHEIKIYREGYGEYLLVARFQLEKLAALDSDEDLRFELMLLIEEIKTTIRDDNWRNAQEECPGITRDEYEAELNATAELIRKTYYSKNGYLKPRLVRVPSEAFDQDLSETEVKNDAETD